MLSNTVYSRPKRNINCDTAGRVSVSGAMIAVLMFTQQINRKIKN